MEKLNWRQRIMKWLKWIICRHDFTDWDYWEDFKTRICRKCGEEEIEET